MILVAVVAFVSCGESAENNANNHNNHDHDHANHEHNNETVTPAADACEHMADGPEQAVTAAAAGGTPPSITDTHTRYDITLVDGAGAVAIEVGEETEMSFFFDADASLSVTDAADVTIAAELEIASVDDCSEVAQGFVYDLKVGTYTLLIESSEPLVSMVPVTAEHAHE